METTKHMTKLLAALLLVLLVLQPGVAMEEAKTSNTRSATCLVKVTAHPGILPLNFETIDSLVRSSAVAGKAVRDVLSTSPSEFPEDAVEIRPLDSYAFQDSDLFGGMGMPPVATQNLTPGVSQLALPSIPEGPLPTETVPAQVTKQRRPPTSSPATPTTRSDAVSRPTGTSQALPTIRRRPRTGPYYDVYGNRMGLYDELAGRYPSSPGPVAPRAASTPAAAEPGEATLLFQLSVNLPDGFRPAAEELAKAIVENLRATLTKSYEDYTRQIANHLQFAESRRDKARSELEAMLGPAATIRFPSTTKPKPADLAVRKQLDQLVDLSAITPNMPIDEAINAIRDSVSPPLRIFVLWKDLYDNAGIERTSEAATDGMPEVRLGTALELLLKNVGGSIAELGYVINDGVVTIATRESLPVRFETHVYEIVGGAPGTASGLVRLIQQTVAPETWYEASEFGEGTIELYMGNQIVVRQSPDILEKIESLLADMKFDSPVSFADPLQPSIEVVASRKQELLRQRQMLDMDMARLQARRTAIEQQIADGSKQAIWRIGDDPVLAEMEKVLEHGAAQLVRVEKLVRDGSVSAAELDKLKMEIARAKIELAKRRQELADAAGGNQLARLNGELSTLAIDLAEKTAEAQVLERQLQQTDTQLAAVSSFDQRTAWIRAGKEAFDIADRTVRQLRAIAAGLNPPTVTVLGANP
jgi:hypothetical protein